MNCSSTSAYESFSDSELAILRGRLHKSLQAHGVDARMPSIDQEPLADQVYRLTGLVGAAALRDRMRVMNQVRIDMRTLSMLDYDTYKIVSPVVDITMDACMMRVSECSALIRPHATDPYSAHRVVSHLLTAATLLMASINSGMDEAYPAYPAGEPMIMPSPKQTAETVFNHVRSAMEILVGNLEDDE